MLKKQVSGMTAQKLRALLVAGIALLIILSGVAFWFVREQLTVFAKEVQASTATANASTQDLANLQTLKTKLAEDADTVERTKNIVADSQYYSYQDQIIKDLNTYASRAGVSITSFSFAAGSPTKSGAQATTPTPAPAAGTAGAASGAKPVAGLKSVGVSVSVKSPVKYTSLMNFVHSIEQNLTKMQLAGVSFTKDPQSDNITVGSLTIEVYTR